MNKEQLAKAKPKVATLMERAAGRESDARRIGWPTLKRCVVAVLVVLVSVHVTGLVSVMFAWVENNLKKSGKTFGLKRKHFAK